MPLTFPDTAMQLFPSPHRSSGLPVFQEAPSWGSGGIETVQEKMFFMVNLKAGGSGPPQVTDTATLNNRGTIAGNLLINSSQQFVPCGMPEVGTPFNNSFAVNQNLVPIGTILLSNSPPPNSTSLFRRTRSLGHPADGISGEPPSCSPSRRRQTDDTKATRAVWPGSPRLRTTGRRSLWLRWSWTIPRFTRPQQPGPTE